MIFSLNLKKMAPLTTGLLMLGAMGVSSSYADSPYTYLVSVQDSNGDHLCNGSYIGDNQILFSPDCKPAIISSPLLITSVVTSPIITSVDSESVVIDGISMGSMLDIEPGVYDSTNPDPSSNQLPDGSLVINGVPINSIPDSGVMPPISIPIDGGIIIPAPIPIPGYPVQVVFNLPDGSQSDSYLIRQRMSHPYSGDQLIAVVDDVPEGVEALTLASDALLDKLENVQDIEVSVVGRYYKNFSEEIGVNTFTLAPITQCPTIPSEPLARRLCLVGPVTSPFTSCTIDVSNKSTGAPIVYEAGSEKFLLGFKKKTTNFIEDCNNWAASSQYSHWLNLMSAKQAGLSVASAYDLGERPLIERTKLAVTFTNHSVDQKFDVFNADLFKGGHFNVLSNTCHTLLPSEDCTISVYTKPQAPIEYQDLLTFEINGKAAGSYIVASSVGQHRFKGDKGSLWEIRGWMKDRYSFSGSVIADGELAPQPTLTRNKHLVDPKNVSVTYRAAGIDQWLLFLNINRKGLFGDGPSLIPVKTLAGTNNEWVTKTFEIEEPGTYQASVTRGFTLGGQAGIGFNVEISSICFNDCSD